MTKTIPARSSGYPRKTDADRLRTLAWFYAVQQASKLDTRELELRYPATLSPRAPSTHRSCLWIKYKNGSVCPRDIDRPESPSLVSRIEKDFPGTGKWYRHYIWQLVCGQASSMDDVIKAYYRLPLKFQSKIIQPRGEWLSGIFWKNSKFSTEELYAIFTEERGLDGGAAIAALALESKICQRKYDFHLGIEAFNEWKKWEGWDNFENWLKIKHDPKYYDGHLSLPLFEIINSDNGTGNHYYYNYDDEDDDDY